MMQAQKHKFCAASIPNPPRLNQSVGHLDKRKNQTDSGIRALTNCWTFERVTPNSSCAKRTFSFAWADMSFMYVTAMHSCRYTSITLNDAQRPRRRTSSADSVTPISHVAPPGRQDARDSALTLPASRVGRLSRCKIFSSRSLKVDPDIGHSFSQGPSASSPILTTSIRSACSSLPAWCRAARNLVFGSLMRSKT